MKKKIAGTAALMTLLSAAGNASACPMCSDLVDRGKDALKIFRFGEGIAWSIAVMISVPYLLIGGGIWMVWRSTRKAAAAREGQLERKS